MKVSALLVLVGLAFPGQVLAVASCPDRAPTSIAAPGVEGATCQATITSVGAKFLAKKLKFLSACKLKNPAGACPTADDIEKIEDEALKAQEKIADDCGPDAAQADLTSPAYGSSTDASLISSCMLSQHSVAADLLSAITNGPTSEAIDGTESERESCVKEVSKTGAKLAGKLLKNAAKCLKKNLDEPGDLSELCVGSFSGGAFVPPTDAKTGPKQVDQFAKAEGKIASKCAEAEGLGQIATMFGCIGSDTVAELQACVSCNGFNLVVDAVEQQFNEAGIPVANGAGALQAAVTAAAAGTKLLIESGDYEEEVLVATDDLQIVGCGAATNDRPRIIPPPVQTFGRGLRAFGVDGLVFQSLEVFDQNNDGIFVQGADGVTFRDIVGDGNFHSKYAVFPIESQGVLIELCTVRGVADAGIYIGQSGSTILRYNDVRTSVASIEFENTVNGVAYGNYSTDNTAGILVFKDNDLIDQSSCHEVDHNVFDANNRVNIGTGTVGGVPDGTGIMVIANDKTLYHDNIVRNHRTFGYLVLTQGLAGFTPVDPDPNADSNFVYDSILTNNGFNPHPLGLGLGGDLVHLAGGTGNCYSDNVFSTQIGIPGGGLPCTLPPAPFPACPAPFTIP